MNMNDFLALAVPLRMAELRAAGGPTDTDFDRLPDVAHELSAHGDVLLYGGKPGETARLASGLADAIAVLAFAPGGVTVAGQHFEAEGITHDRTQEQTSVAAGGTVCNHRYQ